MPIDPITGTLLVAGANAATNVATGLFGQKTAKRNTDKTIQANKELAEYAYDKNLEMWHLQNEYNSPEQQMARFGKAGLNPNLIYGKGTPGNATQLPKYNAPRVDYNYKPPIEQMDQISKFMDIMKVKADTDYVREQAKTQIAETGLKQYDLGVKKEMREETILRMMNENKKVWAESLISATEQRNQATLIDQAIQKNAKELRKLEAEIGKTQKAALTEDYRQQIMEVQRNYMKEGGITSLKDLIPLILGAGKLFF